MVGTSMYEVPVIPNGCVRIYRLFSLSHRHPESTRKAMLERWSDALGLPRGFSFRTLMSTESQLLVWKGEGLPDDDLSQASMKV